jgi:PAS domain S-box-containing protein
MRLSEKIWAGVCMLLLLGLVVFLSYTNSVITTGWFILLAGCLLIIIFSCLFLYRCLLVKEKHEEKLLILNRSLEENRQLIMKAALDAIVCTDDYGHITFWNPQAESIFGWTQEEVKGKVLYRIIVPANHQQVYEEYLAEYHKTGYAPWVNTLREVIAVDRYGKEFPVEFTALVINHGDENFFCTFIRDITVRRNAEDELKETNSEFRKLSSYLQSIREEERKHMAREVHDELGQLVSALKIDIDWLNARIQSLEPHEKKRLDHASETLEILILSIRKMASSLRPSILDDFGLNATIEWQCREFQNMHGIDCDFHCDYDDQDLPVKIKTEMFRIVQESLANVIHHSEARKVTITITSDKDKVHMKIEDDGKGFDKNSKKDTLGLIGLRERAASVNGHLKVESAPGKGTVVHAIIPKK